MAEFVFEPSYNENREYFSSAVFHWTNWKISLTWFMAKQSMHSVQTYLCWRFFYVFFLDEYVTDIQRFIRCLCKYARLTSSICVVNIAIGQYVGKTFNKIVTVHATRKRHFTSNCLILIVANKIVCDISIFLLLLNNHSVRNSVVVVCVFYYFPFCFPLIRHGRVCARARLV